MSDSDVRPGATVSSVGKNPFPGLRPFEPEEADYFFGREQEIYDLLKRLRHARFLAVVGASGCGKSSLVRAGLIPMLEQGYMAEAGNWRVCLVRPGDAPIRHLAEVLSGALGGAVADAQASLQRGALGIPEVARRLDLPSDSRLLVLVDQFEELFQFAVAPRSGDAKGSRRALEEAKAFVKLLLAAATANDLQLYIVLTMRSEWLGKCSDYEGLAEAINQGLYLVPQMNRRQSREVITEPLKAEDTGMPEALVDRLLNDLSDQTDPLPLLQHGLMRMWLLKRDRPSLSMAEYTATGTLARALGRHADSLFLSLSPQQQKDAELLFRTICEVSDEGNKVRKPTSLREIERNTGVPVERLRKVADHFSAEGASLLLVNGDRVDISHEVLLRRWRRLSDWVEDEARRNRRLRRFAEDVSAWKSSGKKEAEDHLYRGSILAHIEEIHEATPDRFTEDQKQFLRASRHRELISKARKNLLWILTGALGLVVLVVATYLYQEKLAGRAALAQERAADQEKAKDSAMRDVTALQSVLAEQPKIDGLIAEAKRPVPTRPPREGPVQIQYFAQPGERSPVDALRKELPQGSFRVDERRANYDYAPCKLWYGSRVSTGDVRLVALTLMRSGVLLRSIEPLSNDKGRERVIQVGWSAQSASQPPLTVERVWKGDQKAWAHDTKSSISERPK